MNATTTRLAEKYSTSTVVTITDAQWNTSIATIMEARECDRTGEWVVTLRFHNSHRVLTTGIIAGRPGRDDVLWGRNGQTITV